MRFVPSFAVLALASSACSVADVTRPTYAGDAADPRASVPPWTAPPSPFGSAVASPATSVAPGTVFACPMHPDVVSDAPGQCPRCGMDLVPRAPSPPAHDHGAH